MKKLKIFPIECVNYLAVDDEGFDWGADPEAIRQLQFNIKLDRDTAKLYLGNIIQHFLESFSEFIGRKITLKELNEAIEKGEI